MELIFTVDRQNIKRIDSNKVVADSRNYLTAKFVFLSPEWQDRTVTAVFKRGTDASYHVLLDNDMSCQVPTEVIKPNGFSVSVFAGDLVTCDKATVLVAFSGYADGGAPQPPTPDIYAQILERLDNISAGTVDEETIAAAVESCIRENPELIPEGLTEDAVTDIVSAYVTEHQSELKGEPGAPGQDGAPGADGITPHIGDNGNWYIGDNDTGQPAAGSGSSVSDEQVSQIVEERIAQASNSQENPFSDAYWKDKNTDTLWHVTLVNGSFQFEKVNGEPSTNEELAVALNNYYQEVWGGDGTDYENALETYNKLDSLRLLKVVDETKLVSANGWLSVNDDGKIINEQGNVLRLTGMSTHHFGVQRNRPFVQKESFETVKLYGGNFIRIAMYVKDATLSVGKGYLSEPEDTLEKVKQMVQWCIELDMYCIVDWHIIDNPSTNKTEALAFWETISGLYADVPNVLFEICNECKDCSYADNIKPYAESVIPVIRANAPNNIIIVGSTNYSDKPTEHVNNPLTCDTTNVMYTFHFYAGMGISKAISTINSCITNKIPVFVTEWGITGNVGGMDVYIGTAKEFLKLLQDNGISWSVWALSTNADTDELRHVKNGVKTFGGWTEDDFSVEGNLIFNAFTDCGEFVPTDSIALSKSSLNLNVGSSTKLTLTITPENATNQDTKWTTSDSGVASVNNGTISAIATGEAIITVTVGSKTAKCTIIVSESGGDSGDETTVDENTIIDLAELSEYGSNALYWKDGYYWNTDSIPETLVEKSTRTVLLPKVVLEAGTYTITRSDVSATGQSDYALLILKFDSTGAKISTVQDRSRTYTLTVSDGEHYRFGGFNVYETSNGTAASAPNVLFTIESKT